MNNKNDAANSQNTADNSCGYIGQPFRHDVFVTYSHGDVTGNDDAYIKTYSEHLTDLIERNLQAFPEIGRTVRVFRDQHPRRNQRLDSHNPLTEELKQHIASSGLLLVLMSPHYLDSEWCKDERDWWEAAQQGHGLPHENRLLIARIWKTAAEKWPSLLCDTRKEPIVGQSFYNPAGDQEFPFDWHAPDANNLSSSFKKSLHSLVSDIVAKLQKAKEAAKQLEWQRKQEQLFASQGGQTIYLHARTPNQINEWNTWGGILNERGFVVQPGAPDPVGDSPESINELRERRVERMANCDAVCLIASDNAAALNDDLIVIGRNERHAAKDRSGRDLPCAVLDPAGVGVANPIVRQNAGHLGVDWIDLKPLELPDRIFPWFGQPSS